MGSMYEPPKMAQIVFKFVGGDEWLFDVIPESAKVMRGDVIRQIVADDRVIATGFDLDGEHYSIFIARESLMGVSIKGC